MILAIFLVLVMLGITAACFGLPGSYRGHSCACSRSVVTTNHVSVDFRRMTAAQMEAHVKRVQARAKARNA